jgi:hypothetical protein
MEEAGAMTPLLLGLPLRLLGSFRAGTLGGRQNPFIEHYSGIFNINKHSKVNLIR